MPAPSIPDPAIEFAENPEPRCPCVLLLDTSSSMRGRPIAALNAGLRTFQGDLSTNPLAARRVEVALVAFDDRVRVTQNFVTVDRFQPPTLTAQGYTYMGTAIHLGLDLLQNRKTQYKQYGISYFRPWIFMITDGEPQGEPEHLIDEAAVRVREEETQQRVMFHAVGVERANLTRLAEISPRPPVKLSGLNFADMFMWLSASMIALSRGGQVELPPAGWAEP